MALRGKNPLPTSRLPESWKPLNRIGNERGQERIGEVRMIEQVEEFRPQLHIQSLGDRSGLIDRQVPLFVGGSNKEFRPIFP